MTTTQNAVRPTRTASIIRALAEELAASARVARSATNTPSTITFANGVGDGIRTAAAALGITSEVEAKAADYEEMWAAADKDYPRD